MSFHGFPEILDRSACGTSDPSGSRLSSRRSAESTISSRPSGRKSMHIGNDGTVTTTSWLPSLLSAITWLAPQSANQSRPSCQRGDSPNTTPFIKTAGALTSRLLLVLGRVDRAGALNSSRPAMWRSPRRASMPGRRSRAAKRHVATDTLGLLLVLLVTAASVQDTTGGRDVVSELAARHPGVAKDCVGQWLPARRHRTGCRARHRC